MEDVKPLLQPEVDLASSVLETIREATDEEYRDALQRDAGRSAAFDAKDNDVTPEESRNLVTIIVSPKDMAEDAMSEASHVQATRCIDSLLGNPRASFNRPPVNQKGLEDILNLPLPGGLLHRQRDSNLAASNVHESVVKAENNLNNVLSGLRLRSDPGLFNLDPNKIGEDISKILSGSKLFNNDSRRKTVQPTVTVNNENFEDDESNAETKISEDAIDIDSSNIDTDPSTSNVHGLFTEDNKKEVTGLQKAHSFPNLNFPLLTKNDKGDSQNLFPLRNLLKLKDVELIPLDLNRHIPKSKVNVPSMKIEPLQSNKARTNSFNQIKLPKLSDLFAQSSKMIAEKGTGKEATDEVVENENIGKSENIQTIPRNVIFKTEILDTIPSTSELKQVRFNKDNCLSLKPNFAKLTGIEKNHNVDTIDNLTDQLKESIPNEEDSLNVSDVGTTQGLKSKSGKKTGNNELDNTEFIDVVDEDIGSDNNELIITPDDYIDDIDPASIDLSELEQVEDRSNHPFSSLETIRRRVVEKLNALQTNNRQALENIKHSVEEMSENSDSVKGEMKASEVTELSSSSNLNKNEFEEEETSAIKDVTFQDLQNMSDSILSASEKRGKAISSEIVELEKNNNRDTKNLESEEGINFFESEEINENENDGILGMDGTKTIKNDESKLEAEMNSSELRSYVNEEESNLCPSDLVEKNSLMETETKSFNKNKNNDNDLTTLASEPSFHSILRPNSKSLIEHLDDIETTLRQSLIVQPAPLINSDNLNIFRTPALSIPDISELNTNIPTLGEIRSRVSEILGGLARQAGDEEVSSEFDSEDFASNSNPVVLSSARSSAPKSIFPSLKPLEDINLDIVQLKPLPLMSGLNSPTVQFPGLNLNTYKAKLSVPKSLDLKPLQLVSTLGNDGGLVGTTLSVGPERKVKTGKSKLRQKTKSNYVSSARNSPTLTDITTSIQNNARSLLGIPESSRGQILQASNVVENFAENLKSHTENTMRNIHQTLYPTGLGIIHADLRKNANNLLNSGRNSLGSLHTVSPINNAVDNLRAQTEAALNHVHQTLNAPNLSELSSSIHRNAENVLNSHLRGANKILKNKPIVSLDSALDSLKAQSENTYRNVQQTLSTYPLEDLSKSIHKTAKHILKPSSRITSENNVLRATQQTIPPLRKVIKNLRSQSDSTLMNIHQSLNSPVLSDISSSIHKSAQQISKSPMRNSHVDVLKNSLPLDNVVDNLRSHTQNTIKHIQKTLSTPTFGDLRAVAPTQTQNLLKSPLATAGRDTFEQILQASPPIIDLTPHAEKAVKDLQKTLKATLRSSPIKDLQSLTNPTHVIQMISDHHEDFNDKLFAIQTDLADRLESMHNDVMDPQRLRTILSSPSEQFELFTIPLPKSRTSTENLKKQVRPPLQSKQPYFDSQTKKSRKPTVTKSYRPKAEVTKLGAMRAASGKERQLPKSLKLPTAASAPVPAKIKKTIYPLFPKKTIFPKPLNSDPFNDPLPPGPEPRKTYQSTTTRRPFIPKPKTGPKLSTPRPNLSPASKRPPFVPIPTTPRPKLSKDRFKPKPLVRQQTPWTPTKSSKPVSISDPLSSASRAVSYAKLAKSKSAIPSGSNTKTATLPSLRPLSSRHNTQQLVKPKPIYETLLARGRSSNGDNKSLSSPIKSPASLLSKLTEALKGKQTTVNLGSPLAIKSRTSEMAPAASENFGNVLAIDNPMKENVAYKCKMTCVKLDE